LHKYIENPDFIFCSSVPNLRLGWINWGVCVRNPTRVAKDLKRVVLLGKVLTK
jgi:hypothetical protein